MLLNLTRPYHKVTLQFLGRELSLSVDEVESLLVDMILDNRINALIDQTTNFVTLHNNSNSLVNTSKNETLIKWIESLNHASYNFSNKLI